MTPKHQRVLFSLAILSWSAALLYFHASGRIVKYLAPDFRPIALAGGLGLAVLGLFNLLTAGEKADHDHGPSELNPWLAFLLMVAPLGLSIAWTKDEYSLAALSRKGLFDSPTTSGASALAATQPPLTREELESGHRRTADGFFEFNLIEIFLATGDREQQGLLDGMKIATEGKLAPDPAGEGKRARLYRLFVTCCAADSRAIPIVLDLGESPAAEVAAGGWAKASGTLTFPLEGGLIQPVLKVERLEPTAPPAEESFLRN